MFEKFDVQSSFISSGFIFIKGWVLGVQSIWVHSNTITEDIFLRNIWVALRNPFSTMWKHLQFTIFLSGVQCYKYICNNWEDFFDHNWRWKYICFEFMQMELPDLRVTYRYLLVQFDFFMKFLTIMTQKRKIIYFLRTHH